MMNLVYCGNENAFNGMLISLLSILKHTNEQVVVYVLTMDLRDVNENNRPITKEQVTYLERMLQDAYDGNFIKCIDATDLFREEMKDSTNLENFYTPYCMLRLFCDKLEELPEKLLYLDTDTVAMGDIKELYDINIDGYEFAGSIDYLGKIFKNIRYINSGVLLLNMKMIRETGLFEKTRYRCKTKRMAFPDQDALNKMALKKLRISSRYNDQRRLHKGTVIRHFCKSLRIFPYIHTINVKPWEIDRIANVLKITYIDDVIDEYQQRIRQYNKLITSKEN